jgi:HK97 family phage portal protein
LQSLPAIISRIFRPITKAAATTGGYILPLGGGWIPSSWGWNWWQQGYDPLPFGTSAVVQACIAAYAQTIAMCPGTHWRQTDNGGRERVENSSLTRVLRQPNSYETISDFMLNLVTALYTHGNAYAVAFRNNRFEVNELHLMDPRACVPRIVPATGDIFYALGGNPIVQGMLAGNSALLNFVPDRDVFHARLETKRHPLIGEPPLTGALLDVAASNALVRQALAYTANEGRPSGVLQTDLPLGREAVQDLRQRWNDQTQGMNAGGTPILTHELKWSPSNVTPRDAELAERLRIADQRIAVAYRIPLPILGIAGASGGGGGGGGSSGGSRGGGAESLMRFWVSTGLGFAVNHLEEAFGRLFGLTGYPVEYVEFDTGALYRSEFKDRLDGLAAGVKGGIYAINEARALEDLGPVPYGDEPRVQQQDVPLSFWGQAPPIPPKPPAAPLPPPPQGNADGRDWARLLDAALDRYDSAA